jgi:thermitase
MMSPSNLVRNTLGFLLIATLWLGFQIASAAWLGDGPEQTKPPTSSPSGSGEFVPGEVLVKFKRDAPRVSVQAALSAQDARAVGQVPALGVQRLRVPDGQELAIIAALRHHPLVEYAEPNYILRAVLDPNDPFFPSQWGLDMIDAPEAWDVTTGSSDIIIAIVDSGIDLDHLDLKNKIWVNNDETLNGLDDDGNDKVDDVKGWDFINNDNNPQDDYGHGTHVAGIAAAETNNSTGVAGLSWGARIMPVKVLGSSGQGPISSVANGITYAADNGAQVINLSLGGTGLADNETLKGAVNYAYSKGCLLVAAAGNCDPSCYEPIYPAAYDHVIAVAATNSSDNRAWFSNYGSYIDVAAPGVSIYSTVRNNGYGYMDGTSMATPFVSGLAALIWSEYPGYTNDQVEGRIETRAVDLGETGWDQYYGHGRIDAHAALLCTPNLGASPQSIAFLADDDTDPIPSSQTVSVLNTGCTPITWTAVISPSTATWLTAIPLSGAATTTSPGSISLSANKSVPGYGTYSAQVVISTTQTPAWGNPQTVDVKLTYMAELYETILPLIFKSYSW